MWSAKTAAKIGLIVGTGVTDDNQRHGDRD
jgi:hypothetical protein